MVIALFKRHNPPGGLNAPIRSSWLLALTLLIAARQRPSSLACPRMFSAACKSCLCFEFSTLARALEACASRPQERKGFTLIVRPRIRYLRKLLLSAGATVALVCPFTGSVELGVSRLAELGRFVAACLI